MRRDSERISDIIEACALVAHYIGSRTSTDFVLDSLFRDAVVRQLTVVGDAAVNLSPEFKARHPEIPWQEIAGFRNRIIHDYFGFNLDTAWQIATKHLPELSAQLATIVGADLTD